MKLISVEISGFRGFAKSEAFDLDADAIVLVGTNGSGKTSVLDSILWALSGWVPRLGDDPAVVLSKYSQTGEARVSLALRVPHSKQQVLVTRVLGTEGDMQVTVNLDGKTLKGPSAEGQVVDLLWPDAASAPNARTSLASVIASSVYLQQDLVRGFIESKSEEDRFKIVSDLVGAGRVTDLQVKLERAKVAWTRATNQQQQELEKLKEQSVTLEAQLDELRSRRSKTADGEVETQWAAWWKGLERFDLKVARVASSAKDASAKLDTAMKRLDGLERATERRLQVLTGVRSDLAAIDAQPAVDVAQLSQKVATLRKDVAEQQRHVQIEQAHSAEARKLQLSLKETSEQLRALAELALKHLGQECPVCGQNYNRDATAKRLRKIVASKDDSGKASSAPEVLPGLLKELSKKEQELSAAQLAARTAEQDAENLRVREQAVTRRLKELGLEGATPRERMTIVEKAIKAANDQIRASSEQREAGELLALQLGQASDQGRIDELQKEIKDTKSKIKEQESVIKDRSGTGDLGQRIVEALREAASTVVTGRLAEIAPLLQSIYSRIDPHPAFRVVSFLSRVANRRGRLNTVIKDPLSDIESQAPSTILSSSQMNALAVSVFLALNLGSHPPLSAAILDDPLQSLDDINLLGLVDLLRRTKDHRQLLVSTHDERFGNLIARKLRPTDSDRRTVVIGLTGWSREGPIVKRRDVKSDPTQLRLVGS